MIARIELGDGAPAELLRLLPLLGLEPSPLGSVGDVTSSAPVSAGTAAPPVALRVEFGMYRRGRTTSPTNLTIAIIEREMNLAAGAESQNPTADFVCDSAIAATCFILARALGLASPILTGDPRMFDVIRAAVALAHGPARVLVEGEIGVGKDSLIKLIHAASGDPAGLIYAECAGLEPSAVEAEIAPLLARAAGADHGVARPSGGVADSDDDANRAVRIDRGALRANDLGGPASSWGGTIFFNHLGELSPPSQVKLLALLDGSAGATTASQVRQYSALATRAAPTRVRFLAAANRPLAAMVARGEFLAELHRLFDATLTIAPLRERPGDLPMLVRHALRTLNPALTLDAAAIRTLIRYPSPGNLRELANFVTRIAIVPATPVTRRLFGAAGEPGKVGRAEVIRQLDHASLKLLWRARTQTAAALRSTRRPRNTPALGPRENATPPGHTGLALVTGEFAQVTSESMRLTASAHPRRRNPRSAPKTPT